MYRPKSGIFFLKTKDLQKTTRYYSELLGFKLVLDQGACRIFRICDNAFIGFCITDESTGSDEVIVTVEVDDVDGCHDYLKSKGVNIEIKPRYNKRYNIYQMLFRDPNGYLIEFQEFFDPSWNQAH